MVYQGEAVLRTQCTPFAVIAHMFVDSGAPLAGWRGTVAPKDDESSVLEIARGQATDLELPDGTVLPSVAGEVVGGRRLVILEGTARPGGGAVRSSRPDSEEGPPV
jgi:hypothetical protein